MTARMVSPPALALASSPTPSDRGERAEAERCCAKLQCSPRYVHSHKVHSTRLLQPGAKPSIPPPRHRTCSGIDGGRQPRPCSVLTAFLLGLRFGVNAAATNSLTAGYHTSRYSTPHRTRDAHGATLQQSSVQPRPRRQTCSRAQMRPLRFAASRSAKNRMSMTWCNVIGPTRNQ